MLLLGGGDVGGAAVIWEDDLVLIAMMVIEGDAKLVRQGIDNGGADAETGEGAGTGHEGDFGEIAPCFAIEGEFVMDELVELLG